jgi:hypothetical protein
MKDKFVTAKIVKLSWIDQFIFLPGAFYCCIMAPVIALISGQDHLFGWPISTWILIGISLLLYAIIERLALIFTDLQGVTFLARNLFKDADAEYLEVSQSALRRMHHTVRRALGVNEEESI